MRNFINKHPFITTIAILILSSLICFCTINSVIALIVVSLPTYNFDSAYEKEIPELNIKVTIPREDWMIKQDNEGDIGVFNGSGTKLVSMLEGNYLIDTVMTEIGADLTTVEGYQTFLEYSYDMPIVITKRGNLPNGYYFYYERGVDTSGYIYFFNFDDTKVFCGSGGGLQFHFAQSSKVCKSIQLLTATPIKPKTTNRLNLI